MSKKIKTTSYFRSLHMKLALILVLLIVSVMAVVGTFLVNNITSFYIDDFRQQVSTVFSTEVIADIEKNAYSEQAADKIYDIISVHSSSLGIDSYRNFYILEKSSGDFIIGTNEALGRELEKTPNVIAAMAGQVGDRSSSMDDYMDIAIPIDGIQEQFIVYIKDTKQELSDLTAMLFSTTIQAIIFGLIVAVLLSFLLSKTMTNPIENLTRGARRVAQGEYGYKVEVQSTDEIGLLTQTFNEMASVLKKTINEAQSERNKLNTLFLHMTDGVAAFMDNGKVIHMNIAAEKMLGVSFTDKPTFSQIFKDISVTDEQEIKNRNYLHSQIVRENRTYDVFFAPFGTVEGDNGIMSVIHDVTEQKELENAQREFVANVSHELRTPLTNIKSYTETISDSGDDLPPEMKAKFLGVILNEADRMTRIVKDLLTLSKLDYGRMDMNFSKFSIKKLLESVFIASKLAAEKQGHKFKLDMLANIPDIYGDRERLEQVFVNIVSNAIKYTPDGGEISIFAGFRNENYIYIKVRDNGLGIPREDIPRLFERFYRVDKARSREKGGTGLGLAIAREIIEIHSGNIAIESRVDEGTVVTVTLPIYNDDM